MNQKDLMALAHYDPETGKFTRLVTKGRFKKGTECGTTDPRGYRKIYMCGKNHSAHRLAWLYMTGEWPDGQIDHIDRNPSNNKFENLRSVVPWQNIVNSRDRRQNTSGVRGVRFVDGKWRAEIQKDRKKHYLGSFESKEEASAAYQGAAKVLFGEFVFLKGH